MPTPSLGMHWPNKNSVFNDTYVSGGQFDFACSSARTMHPHVGVSYV